MKTFIGAAALAGLLFVATPAGAAPVLMISIDGLRPADVLDTAHGFDTPNLRKLVAEGAYATGVRNQLPTVTYPNHTTLITGVWPSVHGITNNTTFDPEQKNMGGWYWYASDIKAPTLWGAVHGQGGFVASIYWPVSAGARSVDANIPEYWRANTADDLKLIEALSSPGLISDLTKATGQPFAAMFTQGADGDAVRAKWTAALIAEKRPQLTTLHIVSLDHFEHQEGPGSDKAKETLHAIDAAVGDLVDAARKAEPDLVVAIVSDHGFSPIQYDVNLAIPFVEAGLITLDPTTGKPTSWDAAPWGAGGSAAIVLKNPNDEAVKKKVRALLNSLAGTPATHIAKVIDAKGIAQRGGGLEPSFWVDYQLDAENGSKLTGPMVIPAGQKGTHGFFPDHPEMRSTFFISGASVAKKGSLGEIDMRDIAPTLARLMGVPLPTATGKPLF